MRNGCIKIYRTFDGHLRLFPAFWQRGATERKSKNVLFLIHTNITRAYMNSGLKRMTQLAWASMWPRFLAYDTHVFSQ